MSTSIFPLGIQQNSNTGVPLAGGKLYFYYSGTSTPKSVYSNSSGLVALSNPVVLDSAGRAFPWLSGYYRVVCNDANDTLVWTQDNVSSQDSITLLNTQWVTRSDVLTYVGATQFSVPEDMTSVYQPGLRITATVSAGTIYGTITASAAGGSPTVTTVTVIWDSGSLDTGLSSVSTGIITVSNTSNPTFPTLFKGAGTHALTAANMNRVYAANNGAAVTFTLPAASAVPAGSWLRLKNLNTGANAATDELLSVTGTVDGVANWTAVNLLGEATLWSDGTSWHGMPSRSVNFSVVGLTQGANSTSTWGFDGSGATSLVVPCSGLIKNLYCYASPNDFAGNTTLILQVNGANTAVTTTIPASNTAQFYDMANSAIFTRGDTISYRVETGAGTGTWNAYLRIAVEMFIY